MRHVSPQNSAGGGPGRTGPVVDQVAAAAASDLCPAAVPDLDSVRLNCLIGFSLTDVATLSVYVSLGRVSDPVASTTTNGPDARAVDFELADRDRTAGASTSKVGIRTAPRLNTDGRAASGLR